jgi:hypothetical protein
VRRTITHRWHAACFARGMISRHLRPMLSLFAAAALAAACGAPPNTKPKATGRTTFGFEKIDVTGVPPLWGSAAVANFVVGGADGSDAVKTSVFETDASTGKITSNALPDLNTGRFCHCALFDPNRKELLVLGGRDKNFADIHDAEIIDTEAGTKASIDPNGAADHPIGCMAFFSEKADKGYIFGGLSSTAGQFSGDTYRYDPAAHTLTKLVIANGPLERYDAGVHLLDNGDVLMVGGMGGALFGVKMLSDMWLFHVDTETWTEIKPDDNFIPPGRRYPWTSMAPDESELLYGFGSDSGTGQHMLGDLWVFHFDANKTGGRWANQIVDGKLPSARGFTYKWPGPAGTAGVLAYGIDSSQKSLDDAFVMQVPDSLAGDWH